MHVTGSLQLGKYFNSLDTRYTASHSVRPKSQVKSQQPPLSAQRPSSNHLVWIIYVIAEFPPYLYHSYKTIKLEATLDT